MVTLKSLINKKPLKEDFKSDATREAKSRYKNPGGHYDMYDRWVKQNPNTLTDDAKVFIEGALWAKSQLVKK